MPNPRVQRLVLHGELAGTAYGGVELALDRIAAPLLERGVEAGQGLVFSTSEAADLDAELAGERIDRLTLQQPRCDLTHSAEAPPLPCSEPQGDVVALGGCLLLWHDRPYSRTPMLHELVSKRCGGVAE